MPITFQKNRDGRAIIGLIGDIGQRRCRRSTGSILNIAKAVASPSAGMKLYGDIPTAAQFAAQLDDLGDVDTIDLFMSSEFADCFDAAAIYGMLQRHPAKITATIDGIAGGSAALIPMAADVVQICEGAHIALSNNVAFTSGTSIEHRQVRDVLQKLDDNSAKIFARRTAGRHQATFAAMMDKGTWLSGAEAVEHGIADKLLPLRRGASNVSARLAELAIHNLRFARPYATDRQSVALRLREVAQKR